MSSLQLFNYEHHEVRTVLVDGEVRIVLSDIAKILGYRDANTASRVLRDHHKGYAEVRTPGGDQQMMVITERGFNRLVIRSNAPNAERVQDWITDDVLPQISRTGTYGDHSPVPDLTSLEGIGAILNAGKAALNRAIEAEARAEKSEAIVETIEGSDGFSLREFHKQYFSDVPERQFFELLYSKRLLLDQRKARWDAKNERWKDGKQHMHPAAEGKQFFFLDPNIIKATGARYFQTKVRPGTPEVNLVAQLERYGLPSNRNQTSLNLKELI